MTVLSLAGVLAVILGTTVQSPDGMPGTIIMLRHAERSAYDHGDGPLSPAGHARARVLARTLEHIGVTAIYVSRMLRTSQTAAPLAEALGLTPIVMRTSEDEYAAEMLTRLRAYGPTDVVLIIGHFNTFPSLLRAMGYSGNLAMADLEHDDLYIVAPQADGPPTVVRMNYGDASEVGGVPVSDSTLIAADAVWDSVRVRGDSAELARLLADEFIHTDENGAVTTKGERLSRLGARGAASRHGLADEFRIQRHGAIAILTHRYREGARAWRNTHVFVWRDGRWQAIAHHSSLIRD